MTPGIMAVGEEPPPMDAPAPSPANRSHRSKPKRKPDGAKAIAGERFAILNAFADFAMADLSRAEIVVWLVLFRDTRDGTARTSYDDIARLAGCNRRNVGRAIRRLEQRGLLRIVHRGGLRRGVSRYRVGSQPKGG